MLMVVILICTILIGFNAFYNTDETQERTDGVESKLKKIK